MAFSTLLYSIVAEPLSTLISSDLVICGIEVSGGSPSKIIQYADDVNVVVRTLDHL